MAATSDVASLTITQSFVGGPSVRGSSEGSANGIGCKFRGKIFIKGESAILFRQRVVYLTPGSMVEACRKDDMHK